MFDRVFEPGATRGGTCRRLVVLGALAGIALGAQAQSSAAAASSDGGRVVPSANPGARGALDLARQLSESFGAPDGAQPQISAARVPPALLEEARRAAAAGDRRRAAELLWQAVPAAPDDVDALVALGRVELDQVHCAAFAQVRHAAALRPADPVVGVLFARTLVPCSDRAQGARALDLWIGDPQTPATARAEALAWRSMMAIERGGDAIQDAEKDARAALGADDRIPLSWQAMLYVHEQQGKFEDTLADADRIGTAGAPAQDLALFRGIALQRLERDDEAEMALSRSLAIEPGRVAALLYRQRERDHRSDLDGALQDARALVAISPDAADYWDAVMRVQAERGDLRGALEAVEQKIRLQPDRALFLAERAEVKGGLGDYPGAVTDYDHSLALDASNADIWIDRATPLWRLDRGSDAVASCLKGLALGDTPRHRSTCTVIEWQAGDHARAVETLDGVLARKEGVELLGGTYWSNNFATELLSYGRMKDAAAWLKFAQKGHPAWTYGAVFLYVARALSGEEAAAREELAARPAPPAPLWVDHLVDYAVHRIDDAALVRLSTTGAADDVPGQVCEAAFYRGLRHWIDGDVAGGRALLADAASTCPRTFNETRIARGWLAAGPGAAVR